MGGEIWVPNPISLCEKQIAQKSRQEAKEMQLFDGGENKNSPFILLVF
jgi:hypothetical protein